MSRKIKYTKSFKIKAVKTVLMECKGINVTSDQFGINRSDLQRWIKFYNIYGAAGLTPKTSNSTYTREFKIKVVRSIEENGLSFKAASLKYNIPAHSTVRKWYLTYVTEGVKSLGEDGRGRPKSMKNKSKKSTGKTLSIEEQLLKENESLKAELALLKKLYALAQAKKKKQ